MLMAAQRDEIVTYARRLVSDGLVIGTAGNVSVRDGDLMAITPSGRPYDQLTPADIVVTDLDGTRIEGHGRPSSELPMHLLVYRSVQAGAVVHAHAPFSTVLSTVLDELPPIHYMIADLGGPVRVAPYASPGSDELARAIAATLKDRTAALLQNHGNLTIAESLARAYSRNQLLEWLCRIYHHARCLGEPTLVPDAEIERMRTALSGYFARFETA